MELEKLFPFLTLCETVSKNGRCAFGLNNFSGWYNVDLLLKLKRLITYDSGKGWLILVVLIIPIY